MMKTLTLTLKRQFFNQIAAGTKKLEYRDIKPYWTQRLEGKVFDEIVFRNGYSKNAPTMRVEWLGMTKSKNQYIIELGKVLEIRR